MKVFIANRGSYFGPHNSDGTMFSNGCSSLDELKRQIVKNYYLYGGVDPENFNVNYSEDMYSEELFLKAKKEGDYSLYEVELHDEEEILFEEYDSSSSFSIKKKEPPLILSTCKPL
jgi:hypothetical protein